MAGGQPAPPPLGGAAEWWAELQPGTYFEVDYEGDHVAHERLALWPAADGRWAVRSPDGDEWLENIDGADAATGPIRSRPLRGPRPRAGMPQLYRFRAPLDERQLRSAIVRGLRLAHGEVELADMPEVTVVRDATGAETPLPEYFSHTTSALMKDVLNRDAGHGRLPVAGPAGGDGGGWGLAAAADSPADEVWLTVQGCPAGPAGHEVRLQVGRDVVFAGRRAMVLISGSWVPAERVAVAAAPGFVAGLRGPVVAEPAPAAEDELASRLGLDPGPAAGGGNRGPATEDARTLWVDWDPQGERYKSWRRVCQESTQEDFEDSRLDGAPTALHMCKAMERQGGDPKLWLERWLREKRLESSDRVAHELRSLTDLVYSAGVIDQVNVGGLVCIEIACRRIAVIVEAYASPSRPSWEHAKFYAGVASPEEVIAPALRTHVLRKAKDEMDLAASKARTALRGAPEGQGGADESGGGGGGRTRGVGRGRGKGGRGEPPPAAE